jgi:hypothetical protein
MATNEEELYQQPNIVQRVTVKATRALRDYAVPLGALIAGASVHVVPDPFTAIAVIFVVLAILEYER